MNFTLALWLFTLYSHAAPCDRALSEAVKAGVIEPSEMQWRQLCKFAPQKNEPVNQNVYLCLFVGPSSARKQMDLGNKEIIVAFTEDDYSKEKLSSFLGVWAPYQGKSSAPGMKKKTILVSVNSTGAVGTKREFGGGSTRQEKIEFNEMEEALHYTLFQKTPSDPHTKKKISLTLDCSKSYSQAELYEQEKEEKKKKKGAPFGLSAPGNQKVNASGRTRSSGISGGD